MNSLLQVAIKNSIDVFYYACLVPMHVLFSEDGEMEKRVFLATWKDIPAQNEVQSTVTNVDHSGGKLCCIAVQATMYIILFFPSLTQVKSWS